MGMAMVVITIAGLVLLFVVLLLVLSGLMCGVVIMPIVGMKHLPQSRIHALRRVRYRFPPLQALLEAVVPT